MRLLNSAESLVARREIAIEWEFGEPAAGLPDSLRLSAEMTHMDHGPAESRLLRVGTRYRGTVLFVMGGSWEMSLFDGERLVLSGTVEVRER